MDPVVDAAARLKAWACGINQPGRYGRERQRRLEDARKGIINLGGM